MATWVPKFKLYNSAGTGLIYTFPAVNFTNAPQTVKDTVEITNLRSKGAIIIPGGEKPWDLVLNFTIIGEDYEDVTSQIVSLENTVQIDTPYVLRIDKTPSSYFEYAVKRLQPFNYDSNLRNYYQEIRATLRANCW